MSAETDNLVYYVISDPHIGGDEQLERVNFLDELLSFLDRLARTGENAELIINGDAFGLWEFTELTGLEKLDALLKQYGRLFEQFRVTGQNVPITMPPGNHDHELAAYDEYVECFAEYNINLQQVESLTRLLGDRVIHFEHGHREDPNNRTEDFGNPHATPMGYFHNTQVTSRAGRLSERGRYNWLKDVQTVMPATLADLSGDRFEFVGLATGHKDTTANYRSIVSPAIGSTMDRKQTKLQTILCGQSL